MGAEKKKSATAQVARFRMHDCEREASRDGRIDGVAALAKDVEAGIGSEMVNAHHHAVGGARGLFAAVRQHVSCAFLRSSAGAHKTGENGSHDGEIRPSAHRC